MGQHPGGPHTITQFADNVDDIEGTASHILLFPGWHDMMRWHEHSTHPDNYIQHVGRYGDAAVYKELPGELQTIELSKLVLGDADTASDISSSSANECQSPGEVANEPLFGSRYFARDDVRESRESLEEGYEYDTSKVQKSMVWLNVVLSADDQLRQRAAWALSQIFVVGAPGFAGERDEAPEVYSRYLTFLFLSLCNSSVSRRDTVHILGPARSNGWDRPLPVRMCADMSVISTLGNVIATSTFLCEMPLATTVILHWKYRPTR